MLRITSAFDSGAIVLEGIRSADGREHVDLSIRRDSHEDFAQWFHFRLVGARARPCTLRFVNASRCTYPQGWVGYRIAASYDGDDWFRIDTTYADGVLSADFTPEGDSVHIAYFEPYSWERHRALIGRVGRSPLAEVETLATTRDGRDLDAVRVAGPGGATGRRQVWIIARQHPGESMAEWFVEGLLERLVDPADALAREALEQATFHVVPNMNPDGSVRGNLRTSATGANLNREWLKPSKDRSPEVFAVRQRMEETGVDLFIDAHGDEALPYVFVAGSEMLPDFTDRQRVEQAAFVADFKAASPDFQDRYGYSPDKYSTDALKLASKWVGHRFGCLSLTLEMPFKDNADAPDARVGWNGARSKALGRAILEPMAKNLRRAVVPA